MNPIFRSDEVRHAVSRVVEGVPWTWPWIPSFSDGIWVRVKYAHDDKTRHERRIGQIDESHDTWRRPPNAQVSSRLVQVYPSFFFMASCGIVR